MIFLPNNFQKYSAAMRIYVQHSIQKYGINRKNLKKLEKIHNFEAFFSKEEIEPIDITLFFKNLLSAVYLKRNLNQKDFDFDIKSKGNYMVNKKVLLSLILNICKESDFFYINEIDRKIVFKAKLTKNKKIEILVKKLNGFLLVERKSKKGIIILPLIATQKRDRGFENAIALLENPLSPVNFYL